MSEASIAVEETVVAEPALERLHPLYLLTGLAATAKGSLGVFAASAYFGASGNWWLVAAMLGGYFGLSLVGLWVRWIRFGFRVTSDGIGIESGLLTRTQRLIPFDRIQDVSIEQGPLARAFGLARVKLETGASAGGVEDGVLDAIALPRANALRDLVRANRASGTHDIAVALSLKEEAAPAVFAMTSRRVLTAGIFNFSLALFAVLGGLSQTMGEVLGIDPFERRFWRDMLDAGDPIGDFIVAHQMMAGIAGLTALVVLGLVTGVTQTVLREHGFRLDRTETGFRRRRGLLTLTDVVLPLRRVQAAIVSTGPLRSAFGWRSLKLQSLARDETGKGDHVVAPLATGAEVQAVIAELGWPPVDPATRWLSVDRAYIWQFVIALLPLWLAGAALIVVSPAMGGALTGALGLLVAGRYLSWQRYGYARETDRLLVRSGFWRQTMIVLPVRNIQSVDLSENFVGRRFGIASLTLGVAGGGGFGGHGIAALPWPTAYALRDELLSTY